MCSFLPSRLIKLILRYLVQTYDVIIFISVNAVIYSEEYFSKLLAEPLKIFAVGPTTAKKLTDKGVKVDAYPLEKRF